MALVTVIPGFFDTSTSLPDLGVSGFEDTFTRPDSTSIGLTEGFPRRSWSVWAGSTSAVHGVRNGEGYAAREGAGPCLATVDAGTADGTHEVTMGDTGSGAQLGAAFRAADVNTYFRLVNSGTSYRLHRVVGGSPTLLAPATDDIIPASGDRIRIELDGASIVCFINDAQVFDVTDNLNATETRHGFFNNGTAADNSIRAVKITA